MNPLRIGVIDTPKEFIKDGLILYANPDYPELYTDLNGITYIDGNTQYALLPRGTEIVRTRYLYPQLWTWRSGLTPGSEYDYWYDYGLKLNPSIEYRFIEFAGFTNYGISGGTLYGGTADSMFEIYGSTFDVAIVDGDLVSTFQPNFLAPRALNIISSNSAGILANRSSYGETAFSGIMSYGFNLQRTAGTTGTTFANTYYVNGQIKIFSFLVPEQTFAGIVYDCIPFTSYSPYEQAPISSIGFVFDGGQFNSFTFKRGFTIGYANSWRDYQNTPEQPNSPTFVPNYFWDSSGVSGFFAEGVLSNTFYSQYLAPQNEGFLKVKNVNFSIPHTFLAVVRCNFNRGFIMNPFIGVHQGQYGQGFPSLQLYSPINIYQYDNITNQESVFILNFAANSSSANIRSKTGTSPWVFVWDRSTLTSGNTYTRTGGVWNLNGPNPGYGGFNVNNATGITGGTSDINFTYGQNMAGGVKVGTFLYYNRSLSDQEIQQTFEIIKNRYLNKD